jgi:hypothetical protein
MNGMSTITTHALSGLNVNLLPPTIIDKLSAIDPSGDKRFLPWLKKCFVQKPFDLKPDFTLVVNAVLRYMMSVSKRHVQELPARENLERWLVQMQLLEQKKYKGLPALRVIHPKGIKEIPASLRKTIEEDEVVSKIVLKELYAGTCYVLSVEPKRWVLVLLNASRLLSEDLSWVNPSLFMEQWASDLRIVDTVLAETLMCALSLMNEKYVHGRYNYVEIEMYYDDFLNGHQLDYMAQDQDVVVQYFQSLQKQVVFKQVNNKVA